MDKFHTSESDNNDTLEDGNLLFLVAFSIIFKFPGTNHVCLSFGHFWLFQINECVASLVWKTEHCLYVIYFYIIHLTRGEYIFI